MVHFLAPPPQAPEHPRQLCYVWLLVEKHSLTILAVLSSAMMTSLLSAHTHAIGGSIIIFALTLMLSQQCWFEELKESLILQQKHAPPIRFHHAVCLPL